ncbi:MAG: hypothetical protein IRY99_10545 [Isosphaeraceae bacterium]|nr:hypothetical protein [Isosphaeraceae bacterium]
MWNWHPFKLVALSATVLTLSALGAEEPTQTVEVDGLSFQAPASWKKTQPTSAMRRAQMTIASDQGGAGPAELVVFVFPGGAGTVQQNVERWERQFKDKQGNPVKAETSKQKGKNVDVTRVEVAGTYTDPFSRKGPQPDHRLLAAIAQTDQAAYFVRLVGPEKTVSAAKPAFDDLIKSMSISGK